MTCWLTLDLIPSLTTPHVPYPSPVYLLRPPPLPVLNLPFVLFLLSFFLSLSPFLIFSFSFFLFICIFFSPFITCLVILSLLMDMLQAPFSHARRRSVDVGGLSLALGSQGLGQGWVGWDESEVDTEEQQLLFAELLSDMYNHTHSVINAQERSAPIDVSLERRAELIRSMDNWHFEPHKLPDHEVLYCSLVIFEALFRLEGLSDMVPASIGM
jgi:hypothetical protein